MLDPEADTNALLNDATEWLQYAREVTDLLIESLEEAEAPDRRRVMLPLGAVAMLTGTGLRRVARGQAKMEWDRI